MCMMRVMAVCGVVLGISAAAQQQPAEQELARKAWGENERALAVSLRGNQVEAESLYRDAMAIWRQLGPAFEGHLATTEANLADVLSVQGRRHDAAEMMEDAVAKLRHVLGEADPRTVAALTTMGGIYLMMGQVGVAQGIFQKAFPLARGLAPEGIETARTMIGLSVIQLRTGNAEEALPIADDALRIALKSAGENTLDAALAFLTVAEIRRVTGRYELALPLFRKARAIYEKILGPEHSRVAIVMSQEGLALLFDGKTALAEKAMTQALQIVNARMPSAKSELFVVETNLALVRIKQKKYADAERLLTTAIAREQREPVCAASDVAGALNTLADVRTQQHQFEEAARLHQRAAAMMSFQ
jgi:tetratricopeptide (TPR) repeat protein